MRKTNKINKQSLVKERKWKAVRSSLRYESAQDEDSKAHSYKQDWQEH